MLYRVLVAERDSASRVTLLSILRDQGAEIDAVTCLGAARRQVAAGGYDLVCADAELADGCGFAFADELRNAHGLPVIITAEQDSSQARDRADACGAAAFLPRPYPGEQIRSLIRSAMAERLGQSAGAEPPRILMYSHDTIGLGHMRRNSNIAREILAARPDASVLMVLGCPTGLVFGTPPGIDYVKLPSLVKQARNAWRPDRLNITAERTLDLRQRLIREAVGAFAPNLILVDHVPTGVWGELIPILEELRHLPDRPEIVLGLRDILDTPEALSRNWRRNGAEAAISRFYDEVLIYGEPALFDTVGTYGIDRLVQGRVRYAGYVAAKAGVADRDAIRARLGVGDRPLALIAGGGGRDAYSVISAAVEALEMIPARTRPAAMVVPGPLMEAELRADIHRRAAALGVASSDRLTDFPAHVAAADFLLGMAGYNSVVEAASIGVPALVVPRTGPSAEQMMRAQVFSRLGLVDTLAPDQATPRRLAARLASLQVVDTGLPRLTAEGAQTAARRILERVAMQAAPRRSLGLAS